MSEHGVPRVRNPDLVKADGGLWRCSDSSGALMDTKGVEEKWQTF
jgi:hypothetical protein